MATKRKTATRPKARPKVRPVLKKRRRPVSTALVRAKARGHRQVTRNVRLQKDINVAIEDETHLDMAEANYVGPQGMNLRQLGLGTLTLTEKEEAILSEPVPPLIVDVKPNGPIYVSHAHYTKWLIRAFGRGQWQLVPIGMTTVVDKSIVVPYVLTIRKVAVAFAMGEQEYFPGNRDQSYGDAQEATVASALRRTCKRLGIGLELWDKRWVRRFQDEHVVRVKVLVKKGDEEREETWHRRRDDPKFWQEEKWERKNGRQPAEKRTNERGAAGLTQTHSQASAKITDPQRQRLWTIVKHRGREKDQVKSWLAVAYNLGSSNDILRKDYEEIIAAIEAPGPLPAREPGSDG